ncbi:hypothetical protein CHLRE_12g516700v5 [Chlamydomonas reinhardtii]|uniref:Uncharacterized protein n=1 Tax=Chlamydomonas reinhardtii TaxID=3055 RepID=A0A2K3D3T3_CHLRE|nr:uncharacterized protein CHLRE_12g516700v5 [Chlamydomonas reinhardtii]PNW75195.1 hypothetical protein CHLRE_12g516700v5 [Chlamydomonas reinhardtii]
MRHCWRHLPHSRSCGLLCGNPLQVMCTLGRVIPYYCWRRGHGLLHDVNVRREGGARRISRAM